MTTGVLTNVDVRALPMLIAEQMLDMGNALNFGTGVVGYNEAEHKLNALLGVLDDYKKLFLYGESATLPLIKQQAYMIRYIQMHEHNPNPKSSQARQLLDYVNYFPVAELPYEGNLDDSERY